MREFVWYLERFGYAGPVDIGFTWVFFFAVWYAVSVYLGLTPVAAGLAGLYLGEVTSLALLGSLKRLASVSAFFDYTFERTLRSRSTAITISGAIPSR